MIKIIFQISNKWSIYNTIYNNLIYSANIAYIISIAWYLIFLIYSNTEYYKEMFYFNIYRFILPCKFVKNKCTIFENYCVTFIIYIFIDSFILYIHYSIEISINSTDQNFSKCSCYHCL